VAKLIDFAVDPNDGGLTVVMPVELWEALMKMAPKVKAELHAFKVKKAEKDAVTVGGGVAATEKPLLVKVKLDATFFAAAGGPASILEPPCPPTE
jgi:hypothetical protein